MNTVLYGLGRHMFLLVRQGASLKIIAQFNNNSFFDSKKQILLFFVVNT